MAKLRIFPQEVMEVVDVSQMELPIIAAKMFRMKLRPTLVDCLIALKNKEVDPATIIEAIKEDARPKKIEKDLDQPQDKVE